MRHQITTFLNIGEKSYYVWKNKSHSKLIFFLESYFSRNEIKKYIEKQSLVKLDVINNFDRKKEIENIMKIIKLNETIETKMVGLIPRLIATIIKNKNLNSFNTISIEKQFELFNEIYPDNLNIKLMNTLKDLGYMQPDTIVAIIDFGEYDFIEMFDNEKIAKKINNIDIIKFFIPFLIYKYNDINSEINEYIIMNNFDDYFKDMNFLNGIEMMVKKEKELFSKDIQQMIKIHKMGN